MSGSNLFTDRLQMLVLRNLGGEGDIFRNEGCSGKCSCLRGPELQGSLAH